MSDSESEDEAGVASLSDPEPEAIMMPVDDRLTGSLSHWQGAHWHWQLTDLPLKGIKKRKMQKIEKV